MPTNPSHADIDVTNRGARAKQLVLALALGLVAATLVYFVTYSVVDPDHIPGRGLGAQAVPFQNAWSFIYAATGLAFALVLSATLVISRRVARNRV